MSGICCAIENAESAQHCTRRRQTTSSMPRLTRNRRDGSGRITGFVVRARCLSLKLDEYCRRRSITEMKEQRPVAVYAVIVLEVRADCIALHHVNIVDAVVRLEAEEEILVGIQEVFTGGEDHRILIGLRPGNQRVHESLHCDARTLGRDDTHLRKWK